MKNKKLLIVLFLSLFSFNASAYDFCTETGYTILTVNGIFTNDVGAKENKENLRKLLPLSYNNEKVVVNYVYNSTHIGGAGDVVDAVAQGLFNSKTDFDLVDMLNDASAKVTTQKVLLVGHSQGNFYANNFYDKVAGKVGGVPAESIGVYSVATPSDRVAGGGKHLTSDTDSVIATLVGSVKNIMTPNTHIDLSGVKSNGHDFSQVYLKYRGNEIVSGIKSSFDKLARNQTQKFESQCISPQKISLGHKVGGIVLGTADFVVNSTIKVGTFAVNSAAKVGTFAANTIKGGIKSLTGIFGNNANSNLAAAGLYDSQTLTDTTEQIIPSENLPVESVNNTTNGGQAPSETKVEIINNNSPVAGPINNPETPIVISETPVVQNIPVNNNVSNHSSGGGGGGYNAPNEVAVVDTTKPVIILLGENIITIPLNTVYVDAGATALDEKDGVIAIVTTGTVDTATLGTYIITYTATDIANNVSTLTRTINIVASEIAQTTNTDVTAPVITLFGQNIVTVFLGMIYTDTGARAVDDTDSVVPVVTTGKVDFRTLGTYTLTYTAVDAASNVATLTRTVNVVPFVIIPIIPPLPVASTTATLLLPNAGAYALDGLDPSRGRKNLTPFVFQVIYTDANNNAPTNVKLHVRNAITGSLLPEVSMNKITSGENILSDGDYANGELYTSSNTYDQGDYIYSFSADDKIGNFTKIEENNNLRFTAISSTYTYIPKYTFGRNNGDGLDWQVWAFNGSNVYDWTDTYVNNYLREQFKIQAYSGAAWCGQCLERGVFTHDPQKGFETYDLTLSSLENNPQNSMNGTTYDVAIQWDSTGYTYTLSHGSTVDATGHTNVIDMNNNLWVSWDGSHNNFTKFPSGDWHGVPYASPMERSGGGGMMMQPYPVYNPLAIQTPAPAPIPTPISEPAPILSSQKSITSFGFESLTPSVNGIIDENAHSIVLTVPYGTVINALSPTIVVSEKASVLPASIAPQDFSNPVTYILKAEDGSTVSYIVTVVISPNPNPTPTPDPTPIPDPFLPDNRLPVITSYTLNGAQGGVTINPLVNNLEIVLNSNKNVNWMSIEIKKESDASVYKMFQSGEGCVDGTNVCTKIWDGLLSSGGLLQNGNYKIKVHMKDTINNEYDDYLPGVIIVSTQ